MPSEVIGLSAQPVSSEDATSSLLHRLLYPFSVFFSSEKKLQSVPFSMIVWGSI